jgi:hypothetical protein
LPDLKLYGTSGGRLADTKPLVVPLEKYGNMPFPGTAI